MLLGYECSLVATVKRTRQKYFVLWKFPTLFCANSVGKTFALRYILSEKCPETCVGLNVKCTLLLPDFNKNWNMSTNVSNLPSMKKQKKKPFNGSRIATCGQTVSCREGTTSYFDCERSKNSVRNNA